MIPPITRFGGGFAPEYTQPSPRKRVFYCPMNRDEEGNCMDMMNSETGDEGGFTIEIEVAADGTITVGWENEAAEQQEAREDQGMQPARDIREACKMVMDIYNQQQGGVASEQSSADAAFQATRGKRGI